MSNHRGRYAPTQPPQYPGSTSVLTGPYAWNAPAKSINPLQDKTDYVETPLAKIIADYQHDEAVSRLMRIAAMTEEEKKAINKRQYQIDLFEEHENELNLHLARLAESKKAIRHSPLLEIAANLNAQPKFIRQPLQQRIEYLRREHGEHRANIFLTEIVESALSRLEAVREKQLTIGYRHIAGRERLDELLRLPELNKREVQTLAAMVAAHMDMIFCAQVEANLTHDHTLDAILRVYHVVAAEAQRLCIQPPYWDSLNPYIRHRERAPYDLLPGAFLRLRCADWWKGKLWRLRNEWREEQLRAACLVHKNASAYASHDAIERQRDQYRRTLEFMRMHELENEDGFKIDLEQVMLSSTSNPYLRYIEMMTTVKGLQNLAEMRGDYAMFYTITCPSKYHATLANGKPNPKWTEKTVRESSDYLVNVFSSIRKKLQRKGLPWYGVRVSEPHHDGTVHWHLLCFMRHRDRAAITKVMREFAIREDRAELGKNVRARFDVVPVTKRKGSPASYIATYIGKNIGGGSLDKAKDKKTGKPIICKETGKPLADNSDNAVAWASLHRVKQFQFFGVPSRQTYRELRRLANQLQRELKPKKGAQLLQDKHMNDVLAAADAGCFATYTIKQGGVMRPRNEHVIRTAYALSETPNDYGEISPRIYGVYSPRLGDESRICTHSETWKLVKKSKSNAHELEASKAGAGVDLGPSGVSPSLGLVAITVRPSEKQPDPKAKKRTAKPLNLDNLDALTRGERRELLRRLKNPPPENQSEPLSPENQRQKTKGEQAFSHAAGELISNMKKFAYSIGWELSQHVLRRLAAGNIVDIEGKHYRVDHHGDIRQCDPAYGVRVRSLMQRVSELRRGNTNE